MNLKEGFGYLKMKKQLTYEQAIEDVIKLIDECGCISFLQKARLKTRIKGLKEFKLK